SMPAASSASSSRRPAGPTKGLPERSSSLPGCSPISMTLTRRAPSPKTVCVPVFQRSQAWQSAAAVLSDGSVGLGGIRSTVELSGFGFGIGPTRFIGPIWQLRYENLTFIMKAAFSKAELESDIASRFGDVFKLHEKPVVETLSTGVDEIDALTGGLPRGAISEFFGPASSGRTSLMYSMLGYATAHEETCALIDTNDVFAPTTAAASGIDFDRLLWVRCAGNLEHAFKAADLLLHAGGFGLVI